MANFNGQTDEILDSESELFDEFGGVHADNLLAEDGAVVIGTEHNHTIEERLQVELLEEGGLGVSDTLSNRADLELLGDLDLSLFDLGGDLEGVEEVDLRGIEAGGSRLDDVVDRRGGADLCFSGELALLNLALEIENGLVGEDQTDLFLEVGKQSLEFWLGSTELLEELVVLVVGVEGLGPEGDDLVEEGLRKRSRTFLAMTN